MIFYLKPFLVASVIYSKLRNGFGATYYTTCKYGDNYYEHTFIWYYKPTLCILFTRTALRCRAARLDARNILYTVAVCSSDWRRTLMVIIKVPKVNGARIKQIQIVRKTVAAIIILLLYNTVVAAPRLMPVYTTPEGWILMDIIIDYNIIFSNRNTEIEPCGSITYFQSWEIV